MSTEARRATQRKYRQSPHGKAARRRADKKRRRKAGVKSQAAVRHGRRVAKIRALLAELKSKPCADCNGTFDPVCMDYDHREPENKSGAVGKMVHLGMTAFLAEVEKCDLVCSNCHRIRTFKKRDHRDWVRRAVEDRSSMRQR